jgi:hypothetical protein
MDKHDIITYAMIDYNMQSYRVRGKHMRVRPFFWLLLLATSIGVIMLAVNYQPRLPAYIAVQMQSEHLQVHNTSDLLLHVMDTQGLPIDQAAIVSKARMTNMDMSSPDCHVIPLGDGRYQINMELTMAGPWSITIQTRAHGFAPQEHTLMVNVV